MIGNDAPAAFPPHRPAVRRALVIVLCVGIWSAGLVWTFPVGIVCACGPTLIYGGNLLLGPVHLGSGPTVLVEGISSAAPSEFVNGTSGRPVDLADLSINVDDPSGRAVGVQSYCIVNSTGAPLATWSGLSAGPWAGGSAVGPTCTGSSPPTAPVSPGAKILAPNETLFIYLDQPARWGTVVSVFAHFDVFWGHWYSTLVWPAPGGVLGSD